MSSNPSADEQSLREQVEQSNRTLEGLQRELRGVDGELEALAQQHPQYELLDSICHSLTELDKLGAAELFWNASSSDADQAERIAYARNHADRYSREIARVESRREEIIEKIGAQNSELDYLHYDLQDILEQQEERANEWLVEREDAELPFHVQIMPWARGTEEDQRLNRSLLSSLATSLAFAFLLSVVALPLMERPEDAQLPERVARLVREERQPPPPPPPVALPETEIPEPLPEPELVDEATPEPAPEQNEQPVVADVEQPDTREQVKSKGLLAFRDSFASRAELRPAAQLGSQARLSNAGANSTGRPERMMVSTSAPGSSGGINLADISRDFGGGGGDMAGVATTRVASNIGGGDGPNRPLSSGASAGRTDEEIQIVFDRYKAALYRLYNRELRKDPTLRGQLVLQLTIEPDGSVSLCQLYSSSMDAPLLADQVVDRVLAFDFGAKEDIVAVTIIYPIDFLPAA